MEAIRHIESTEGFGTMREAFKKHEAEIAQMLADQKKGWHGWLWFAGLAGGLATLGVTAVILRSLRSDD